MRAVADHGAPHASRARTLKPSPGRAEPECRNRSCVNCDPLLGHVIKQELREKVADIVRTTLVEHFADKFVFDPIKVIPAIDEFGDGDGQEYLRIMIVFDGDQKALDPGWTSGLIRRIRPRLIEAGVREFPSPSFVKKSEWPQLERSLKRAGA